jgi:hypothetical protein
LFFNIQTIIVDTGYTGTRKLYGSNNNILIPKKNSKRYPLTEEDIVNTIGFFSVPNTQAFS